MEVPNNEFVQKETLHDRKGPLCRSLLMQGYNVLILLQLAN